MSDAVFLGTDAGAAICLRALAAAVDVGLVVTPPPRRRGRRGTPTPTPVGAAAEELGLPVLGTPDVNRPEDVARVRAAAPRLLVVVAFGQILRRDVRDVPTLGSLNLHFSLLPRWRGAAPVQHAILAGDEETGACVQRLVAKLDAGDVLAESRETIAPTDDTPTLRGRLVERGAPLLVDVVTQLLAGEEMVGTVQDAARVTIASMIRAEEGALDPTLETAIELDRRIRGLDEWPGCRATFVRPGRGAQPVLVRRASVASADVPAAAPGQVVHVDRDAIVVACRSGSLRVTELQKPGKRPLPVRDFVNGCPVEVGDVLVAPLS